MNFRILCLLLFTVGLFACKKDQASSPEENPTIIENNDAGEMSDLQVPNGFNYSVTHPVTFNLTTVDSTGAKVEGVLVNLAGISQGEIVGNFYSGISQANGLLEVTVDVPNHFTEILVNTIDGGEYRSFEFVVNDLIEATLDINSNNLMGADDRGANCYPQITGIFSDDNKLIGISSTIPLEGIELVFSDGSTQTITNSQSSVSFTTNVVEICDNGIDDDGDGLTDCADPQCGADITNCNGSLPCISAFYQIVGSSLMQLDPTTGNYSLVGDLPAGYTYNGSGFNPQDGYIYCTGKSNGKTYLMRMYGNANVTNLGELVGFEGRSYTGDIDDNGNWTNFYYSNSTWNMAQVAVNDVVPTFVSTPGIDNSAGNVSHHDWVYNATCDKFYTMEAGGKKLLVADHKATPPTVGVVTTYSNLEGGAYGAAWADVDGNLYFSNNNTGKIYKISMNSCSPTGIEVVLTGAATGNNDGMSCPYSPTIEFGAADTDGDGITDNAELISGTNPTDGCDPNFDSPTCDGIINYSFVGGGSSDKTISYVLLDPNCDAPPSETIIYNNDVDNDIDNDGVPNASDPDPIDPNKTFVQYTPSQNSYGTYAFEDLWPEQGDYDFNDFVVQVREEIVTNSSNAIYQVVYDMKIMAMGGGFNNNFGITLPDPNNAAQVEIYSPANSTHEVFQRDGRKVVILKHPKALFYTNDLINAENGATYYAPVELRVTIDLDGAYQYPGGYSATFFIEQNGVSGHEIHMPSVQPTNNMNIDLYGTIHDDTNPGSGKYFMTSTNLPWGLYVPTEWQYPLEGEEILDAYLEFDDYAQSNPALPWYQNNGGNVNSSKVYTQH